MLSRFIRSIFKHRAALGRIARQARYQANTVLDIDPEELYKQGTRILVLDFDGVLNHHDATTIASPVLEWVLRCQRVFGADHLYLHSNNNRGARIDWISQHIPGLQVLDPANKKPSPEGLLSIMAGTEIKPETVILIDDRLLTGMLAVCRAGCQGIYIRKPYTDFTQARFREVGFWTLRRLELFFCKIL